MYWTKLSKMSFSRGSIKAAVCHSKLKAGIQPCLCHAELVSASIGFVAWLDKSSSMSF